MAYKLINKEWSPHLNSYKHDYIVDTESDIKSLPECCARRTWSAVLRRTASLLLPTVGV